MTVFAVQFSVYDPKGHRRRPLQCSTEVSGVRMSNFNLRHRCSWISKTYYLISTLLSQLWLCRMNIKDASVPPPPYLQSHCFLEMPLRHIQSAPCTLQLSDRSQAPYLFRATSESLLSRICPTSETFCVVMMSTTHEP